jgi:hypothetical protein
MPVELLGVCARKKGIWRTMKMMRLQAAMRSVVRAMVLDSRPGQQSPELATQSLADDRINNLRGKVEPTSAAKCAQQHVLRCFCWGWKARCIALHVIGAVPAGASGLALHGHTPSAPDASTSTRHAYAPSAQLKLAIHTTICLPALLPPTFSATRELQPASIHSFLKQWQHHGVL